MKQIVWFEQDAFKETALKEYWKQRQVNLVVLNDTTDFSYIVKDFAPDVIIANYEIFSPSPDHFIHQLVSDEQLKVTPLILVADQNTNLDDSWGQLNFAGFLSLPLNMTQLQEDLEKILKS
jgi:AmiR/NasT family two-component response regulator